MPNRWIKVEICPLCGIKDSYVFHSSVTRPDFEVEYAGSTAPAGIFVQYVQCRACGLVYQNPRMDDETLDKFYSSGDYRKFVTRHSSGNEDFDNKERGDAMSLFGTLRSLKITSHLDIGASRGYLLGLTKAKFGCRTVAVEPNMEWLEERPDIVRPALYEVVWKFDLITCMHVLEHVSDFRKMLGQIRERLTDDGLAIVEVPTGPKALRLPHLTIFDTWTLYRACSEAELVIESIAVNPHIRVHLQRQHDKI